jgi:GDP-L-fucose synthase
MSPKRSKIYVAGHNGLVGSAIIRRLKFFGYKNIITVDRERLDLTNQLKVLKFLKKTKPKFIIIAAAKVFISQSIKLEGFSFANFVVNFIAKL